MFVFLLDFITVLTVWYFCLPIIFRNCSDSVVFLFFILFLRLSYYIYMLFSHCGVLFNCHFAVDCGPPLDIVNANYGSVTVTTYLETVLYTCDNEMTMTGDIYNSTCQANKTWTETNFLCSGELPVVKKT